VDIINDHNAEDAPLFLYVAHLAVHGANSGQLLEAPREDVERFGHIMDPNRRIYAGNKMYGSTFVSTIYSIRGSYKRNFSSRSYGVEAG
jgi:hypothetical protein